MSWFKKKDRYRPVSPVQRALILLLAVATASVIMLALLGPALRLLRAHALPPPDRAPCSDGQTRGCVGGQLDVIVVAPAAPASAGP